MTHVRLSFRALACGLALLVAGCASGVTAVSGAFAAGPAYTLNLGRTWSDVSTIMANRPRNVRVLSIDGPILNRLYVAHDIADGAGLIRAPSRETRVPVYRADMTSRELVEFITESLAALDYLNPQVEELLPASFAGRPGVRFRLRAQTREGLEMSGAAMAAAQDARLQTVIFMAASEHYFEAHRAEVEQIFSALAGEAVRIAPPQAEAEAQTTAPL